MSVWEKIQKPLEEFIATPNITPMFYKGANDYELTANATIQVANHILRQNIENSILYIISCEALAVNTKDTPTKVSHVPIESNISPLLIFHVKSSKKGAQRIGFYGHIDKQPPMSEKWSEGLNPYKMVCRDDKVYGRGAVDDGYALFMLPCLLQQIHNETNGDHDEYLLIFEASEESGSCHLDEHLSNHMSLIGDLNYLFCMDSGGVDNSGLWVTTGLRGCMLGDLKVKIAENGFHSGDAGGLVPSAYMIANQLVNRLRDEKTGKCTIPVDIPDVILSSKERVYIGRHDPTHGSVELISKHDDPYCAFLANTIYPNVTVIGIDGIPSTKDGGNVIVPEVTIRLSIRIPPMGHLDEWVERVQMILLESPPFNAQISYTHVAGCNGWIAKPLPDKIRTIIDETAKKVYNVASRDVYCGGSIPFMNMLAKKNPECFIIPTGVCTSTSNMHGPDEHLSIHALENMFTCLNEILMKINQIE